MSAEEKAQRWHDTDHGKDRPAARKGGPHPGGSYVPEPDADGRVSHCWCCCEQCDPGYGAARPNPFFKQATAVMSLRFVKDFPLPDGDAFSCWTCGEPYESARELLKHIERQHDE